MVTQLDQRVLMLSKEFIFGCQKWTPNAPRIIAYDV